MEEITYQPIGTIHSPFKEVTGMPIQPSGAQGVAGFIEIRPEYAEGLADLDGFSHIIVLYHFHRSTPCRLKVRPFLDDTLRGVFASRAPSRPNAIGISVVKLVRVEGCTLHIEEVDILDSTPLLDIKPYVPSFDVRSADRTGWLSGKAEKAGAAKADERFK
jgi:tRNA-Thr(GGU) m(6)t(6)A37 methyltransferase TsaA